MITVIWIFVAESDKTKPLTFEELERADEAGENPARRQLISMYEGRNRVLPIE
jgi:hypothetical protein